MLFINIMLVVFNSFQFRLLLAELLFCICLPPKKLAPLMLPLLITLVISFPELAASVFHISFYTTPFLQVGEYHLSFMIIFIVSLCCIALCFQVSFRELLFLGAGAYIVQNLIYDVALLAKEMIFPNTENYLTYDNLEIFSTDPLSLYSNLLSVGILAAGYVILYFLFIRRWNREHRLYIKGTKLIVFLIVTIILLNGISYRATQIEYVNSLVILLLAVCSGTLLLIQFNSFDLSKAQYEQAVERYIEQTARNQQRMSEEAAELINIKAHDLKRSLEVIRQEQNSEAVRQELAITEQAINDYNSFIKTGNKVLDTILTEKNIYCLKHDIEFTFQPDGRAVSFMNHMDIYVLFGNALDNAIEHLLTEEKENRIMSLSIVTQNGCAAVALENYCSKQLAFQEGLPCTSKEDKRYHGFGLKSIRSIVQKYQGHMVVGLEHNIFSLRILIPQNAEKK